MRQADLLDISVENKQQPQELLPELEEVFRNELDIKEGNLILGVYA